MADFRLMTDSRKSPSIEEMRNISLWILVLLATSWSYTTRDVTVDLRSFGAIIAPAVCIILVAQIWKSLRNLLDQGAKIPHHEKLVGRWSSFLIFFPICLEFSMSPHGADKSTFCFGGGLSIITALLGGTAIILYETLRHIKSFAANGRKTPFHSHPREIHSRMSLPKNS